MNLHGFSLLLAVCSIATFLVTIVYVILFFASSKFRAWEKDTVRYNYYLRVIGFLAIFSTVAVLIYQLYYELRVCELCWWQRICMFPIDIIVLVSLFYNIKKNHVIVFILSLLGVFFSGYHYYYHFKGWVLGQAVFMPCQVGGLLPACTDNEGILAFGFLTIPGMALLVFLSISILSLLAHVKSSSEE